MTTTSSIKKRILKQRGVSFQKHTKKPISIADIPAVFHKTALMKLLEWKFNKKIDVLLDGGTIYKKAKELGINATTVYKWRIAIARAKEAAWFEQFKE